MGHRAPRLGIDARIATGSGFGTYLQNLVPRLATAHPDWSVTAFGDPDVFRSLGWTALPNVSAVRCSAPYYSVSEQIELPMRVRQCGGVDVFWAPHYNVPLLVRAALAVTIHDVCHLALPESTSSMLQQLYASFMYRQVRRRARAVLFVSEFTRREFQRLLGAPAGAAEVALNGVDPGWTTADDSARPISERYFVYVGTLKRHKNVPMLLRAFARLGDRLPHHLVLVGRRSAVNIDPAIGAAAAELGNRVHFTDEVTPSQLRQYVSHADALVTASLYEGFGLPPLEAMAAGRPCVVAASGSLPEICGDAALYCDPRDEESIAQRLYEVATDGALREALIARGRARARDFTWERAASITGSMLDRALRAGADA